MERRALIQSDGPTANDRIRAGSARGSRIVSERFRAHLTRRRFCEELGIHPSTLRRWEAANVVRPELIRLMNSPTFVFTAADVRFGKLLKKQLDAGRGTVSLLAAAEEAADQIERSR